MNAVDIAKAILSLRPNAEFSFQEADYSTVKWDVLDGEAPTIAEIEAAAKLVEKAEAEAIKTAAAAKAALLAKLGITENEAKLLLS